ncbi:MAG: AAA family ATPase, partial [Rhodothermaceae bacterium]|nr:AAA family ATPase [Rhodothermaceae bacterium]
MYLSKLELHGFKSFAQKTTLTFDPGVTAIVGPNGCGKSNVIDAVRWVLGEQRARLLRSDRMENVIFNGTSKRRALGLAEVSLTIENTRGVLPTEYSEVTITRRLYRSGESEYLLNGTVCRLKDILDLFMDTGMGAGAYSVIELKMIEDILSDNAADRRRLFEEAAGVTKYKMRRRQALNKLDSTQTDLTRLADLTDEVERTVRSLQRQAQKAARHQRLADRLLLLELALAAWDYEQLADEHRTLDRDARHLRTQVEALTTHVGQGEAALEQQRTGLVAREQALSQRQQLLNTHTDTVRQLEAETRVGAERRASDTRALDRLARESEADHLRRQELTREEDTVRRRLTEAEATHAEA